MIDPSQRNKDSIGKYPIYGHPIGKFAKLLNLIDRNLQVTLR